MKKQIKIGDIVFYYSYPYTGPEPAMALNPCHGYIALRVFHSDGTESIVKRVPYSTDATFCAPRWMFREDVGVQAAPVPEQHAAVIPRTYGHHGFPYALLNMLDGMEAARASWPSGVKITSHHDWRNSAPKLMVFGSIGSEWTVWLPTQADMHAHDWFLVAP